MAEVEDVPLSPKKSKRAVAVSGNGLDTDARNVSLEDFYAYSPLHKYIFIPDGAMWPLATVNSRIEETPDKQTAAAWLDKNRAVEQMMWAPGEPQLIQDRLMRDGGWLPEIGRRVFNLYRPPLIVPGNPGKAGKWIEHINRVYPDEADHIINWLAQRVQNPAVKINHALVIGGKQGIGKDTLIEPVRRAIGHWNFGEVKPTQIMEPYNGYLRSVIMRVSEARDLGEVNRYQFYDHMKDYTASPPDMLRINEKYIGHYSILNCTGVIITTNHKSDGIYLPTDDRRHFVAWSNLSKEDFGPAYWNVLWGWYNREGYAHVAAYLRTLDISAFDPKAPPPKTAVFWDIADANRAPEDAELSDIIDNLGNPPALTLEMLRSEAAGTELLAWLIDRKNRRAIPHRLEACDYTPVRNDTDKHDGHWKINGIRQTVYARQTLSVRDRIKAASKLVAER